MNKQPGKRLTYMRKLSYIREHKTVHEICFRNAGVGILFYDPPKDFELPPLQIGQKHDDTWKKYLKVSKYYPTLEKCINEEFKKLLEELNAVDVNTSN